MLLFITVGVISMFFCRCFCFLPCFFFFFPVFSYFLVMCLLLQLLLWQLLLIVTVLSLRGKEIRWLDIRSVQRSVAAYIFFKRVVKFEFVGYKIKIPSVVIIYDCRHYITVFYFMFSFHVCLLFVCLVLVFVVIILLLLSLAVLLGSFCYSLTVIKGIRNTD